MCETAAFGCRTVSNIEGCMRDALKDLMIEYGLEFCSTSEYNLLIAQSYHDSAFDRWTDTYAHIAIGGNYECLAACVDAY